MPRDRHRELQSAEPCSGSEELLVLAVGRDEQIELGVNQFRSSHSAANQITLFSSALPQSVSALGASAGPVAL